MRNNFHLKFKEWKGRKKKFSKVNWGIFFQGTKFTPPVGALQKKLVSNEDSEEEKKIAEERKQK